MILLPGNFSPQLLIHDVEGDVADVLLPHHLWRGSSLSCTLRCAGVGVTSQADRNIFTPMGKTYFLNSSIIVL